MGKKAARERNIFDLLPFGSSGDVESVRLREDSTTVDVLVTLARHIPPDQQLNLVAEYCFVEPSARPVSCRWYVYVDRYSRRVRSVLLDSGS